MSDNPKNANEQFELGMNYAKGNGVPVDFEKVNYWFAKAAEQGHAEAQYRLGINYHFGDGVLKDKEKAFGWFAKAAEQGYAEAQHLLGVSYNLGKGVSKDFEKYVYWLTKAAEQGHIDAQYSLGMEYIFGSVVSKDFEKYVYWLTKAAEQGHKDAQAKLGFEYFHGTIIVDLKTDFKKARHWLGKAAEQGDEKSRKLLTKIEDGTVTEGVDLRPLFDAISHGNVKLVKSLISKKIDVNARDDKGWTPLHHTVVVYNKNVVEIAKFLISAGADVNAKNGFGVTPLHLAWKAETASLLISAKADVNAKDDLGKTPLHDAACNGNVEVAKILVSAGADVNAKDDLGKTPLFVAKGDVVQYLSGIDAKAETNGTEVFSQGYIHFNNKDYNNALKSFDEAISLNPNDAIYYLLRGNVYYILGQKDQAIKDLTETLRLDPNNRDAYRIRGAVYLQSGQFLQTIKDLSEAIKLYPSDAVAYSNRGRAHCILGNYDQAVKDLSEAIKFDPSYNNFLLRGEVYARLGQNDKAKHDLEKVISMNPDSKTLLQAQNMLRGMVTAGNVKIANFLVSTGSNVNTKSALRTESAPKIGSIVPFGDYNWRVLDVQTDRALIITEDVVERCAYNKKSEAVTWESCTLRGYLNEEFYNQFSAEEKSLIMEEIPIHNPNNLWYQTRGGRDTEDRIFLLSLKEADKYFGDSGDYRDKRRKVYKNGKFVAANRGYYFSNSHDSERVAKYGNEAHQWWLRSPGYNSTHAAHVDANGGVYVFGRGVGGFFGGTYVGVRPALWLHL